MRLVYRTFHWWVPIPCRSNSSYGHQLFSQVVWKDHNQRKITTIYITVESSYKTVIINFPQKLKWNEKHLLLQLRRLLLSWWADLVNSSKNIRNFSKTHNRPRSVCEVCEICCRIGLSQTGTWFQRQRHWEPEAAVLACRGQCSQESLLDESDHRIWTRQRTWWR